MVAFILILALVAELGFYAWLGLALGVVSAGAPAAAVLWCLAGFVSLRAFFATLTRLVGRRYRDQTRSGPAIGTWRYLRAVLWDVFCYVLIFSLTQPLEALLRPRRQRASQRPAVLLVHGLWCNGGIWWALQRRLERAGWVCATMNYAPPLASIDAFVPQLAAAIDKLRADTGAATVHLVCHSMGGLVTRAYLAQPNAASVASVITLGTPHHGSGLARWTFGRCVREMRLGSAWLAALNRREGEQFAVPFVSVLSWQDNLVTPPTSSVLRGARNLAIAGVGHVSMPWTAAVQDLVLALLENPQAQLPGVETLGD